jgi:hypothetical protein
MSAITIRRIITTATITTFLLSIANAIVADEIT